MTAREALAQAKAIVDAMKQGAISYDNAKEKCEPLFRIAYERTKIIARRHGQTPHRIIFASFAR